MKTSGLNQMGFNTKQEKFLEDLNILDNCLKEICANERKADNKENLAEIICLIGDLKKEATKQQEYIRSQDLAIINRIRKSQAFSCSIITPIATEPKSLKLSSDIRAGILEGDPYNVNAVLSKAAEDRSKQGPFVFEAIERLDKALKIASWKQGLVSLKWRKILWTAFLIAFGIAATFAIAYFTGPIIFAFLGVAATTLVGSFIFASICTAATVVGIFLTCMAKKVVKHGNRESLETLSQRTSCEETCSKIENYAASSALLLKLTDAVHIANVIRDFLIQLVHFIATLNVSILAILNTIDEIMTKSAEFLKTGSVESFLRLHLENSPNCLWSVIDKTDRRSCADRLHKDFFKTNHGINEYLKKEHKISKPGLLARNKPVETAGAWGPSGGMNPRTSG